jgi:hypothetical protein
MVPGFENARAVYDKFKGQAKNPNLESVFKSVPFRAFTFPFTFAPKNLKEKDSVHKILQLFRFHMLPEHQNDANGYFNVPSEFQITYMYRDKENTYLPRISRCVLKKVELIMHQRVLYLHYHLMKEAHRLLNYNEFIIW